MRKFALASLLIFLCNPLDASTFRGDLRYMQSPFSPLEQAATVGLDFDRAWGRLSALGRFTHSLVDFQSVDLMGEYRYSFREVVGARIRALHRNRFRQTSATTWYGAFADFTPRLAFASFYFSFGGYLSMHRVASPALFLVLNPSFTEVNFALTTGVGVHFMGRNEIRVVLSTIDSVEVHNPNHPFLEVAWLRKNPTWALKTYVRYHALLGFGREQAWVAGAEIAAL